MGEPLERSICRRNEIMNRNRHLNHKPIMIDKKLDFGVGVLFLCPKCKSILKSNQKKCECGCGIRWK